jgi:hypothetical protein
MATTWDTPIVTPAVPIGGGAYGTTGLAPPTIVTSAAQLASGQPSPVVTPVGTPALTALAPPVQLFGAAQPAAAVAAATPEAVFQAAGIVPASSYLGSILGAALGGADQGTGPLPAGLGGAAINIFGTNLVPKPGSGELPGLRLVLEAHGPFVSVLETLGASLYHRLAGLSARKLLDYRLAFADGQGLTDPVAWRAHVLSLLNGLMATLQAQAPWLGYPPPGLTPALPPVVTPAAAAPTILTAPTVLNNVAPQLGRVMPAGSGAATGAYYGAASPVMARPVAGIW